MRLIMTGEIVSVQQRRGSHSGVKTTKQNKKKHARLRAERESNHLWGGQRFRKGALRAGGNTKEAAEDGKRGFKKKNVEGTKRRKFSQFGGDPPLERREWSREENQKWRGFFPSKKASKSGNLPYYEIQETSSRENGAPSALLGGPVRKRNVNVLVA